MLQGGEEKNEKLAPSISARLKPTVHFGDDTNICDLSDATSEDVEIEQDEEEMTQTKEKNPNNSPQSSNIIPKTNFPTSNPNSVPIIKVGGRNLN